MPDGTRHDLQAAVRAAWALDPVDADDWSAANPSRGQCGPTALTIHDLLGGELLLAEVLRTDGSRHPGLVNKGPSRWSSAATMPGD